MNELSFRRWKTDFGIVVERTIGSVVGGAASRRRSECGVTRYSTSFNFTSGTKRKIENVDKFDISKNME